MLVGMYFNWCIRIKEITFDLPSYFVLNSRVISTQTYDKSTAEYPSPICIDCVGHLRRRRSFDCATKNIRGRPVWCRYANTASQSSKRRSHFGRMNVSGSFHELDRRLRRFVVMHDDIVIAVMVFGRRRRRLGRRSALSPRLMVRRRWRALRRLQPRVDGQHAHLAQEQHLVDQPLGYDHRLSVHLPQLVGHVPAETVVVVGHHRQFGRVAAHAAQDLRLVQVGRVPVRRSGRRPSAAGHVQYPPPSLGCPSCTATAAAHNHLQAAGRQTRLVRFGGTRVFVLGPASVLVNQVFVLFVNKPNILFMIM